MAPERVLVIIATYNELENLPRLVDEVLQYLPLADVLVIDDNSPDGTGRWCDQQAADEPRLQCLHRAGKLGLGTAIVAGLQYAIDRGYAYVISMDADFSHQPRYLPDLLAGSRGEGQPQGVDVMIGSRYIKGGGTRGWPLSRRVMSRCVNMYARVLLGLQVRDCSGGLRCYRTELLKQLDFDSLESHGYSFFEEILWRLKCLGARFGETPIVFIDREKGQSKINTREAFAALGIIFSLGVRNWLGRKPASLQDRQAANDGNAK